MLIDTHCHIHDQEEYGFPDDTVAQANQAGVEKIIVIGTSIPDSTLAQKFANSHSGVFYSYGIHPHYAEEFNNNQKSGDSHRAVWVAGSEGVPHKEIAPAPSLQFFMGEERADRTQTPMGLSQISEHQKLVAIGEIGLDYHYPEYNREAQIHLLEQMLQLSIDTDLPCIFHIREAFPDFWAILDNFKIKPSVLHSFSDSPENLSEAINRGFMIGINGLATFTKIPIPPLSNMVLETDAPYLTPIPFRGKINTPAYIPDIARWVAEHHGVTLEKVAEITTQNAERLFNI